MQEYGGQGAIWQQIMAHAFAVAAWCFWCSALRLAQYARIPAHLASPIIARALLPFFALPPPHMDIVPHDARRRCWLGVASLSVLGLLGCDAKPQLGDVHGLDLSQADFARDFQLQDAQGQPRGLTDFRGKVLLVFFGFTQCPDICPTALFRATEVKALLGQDADRLDVAFITVDPERDTPEVLDAYVKAFDPSFIGLYGNLEQTRKTAQEFKVYYAKVPTGASYTMDHTALTYVFDTRGKLQLALRHNQTAEEVAHDVRRVLALG